MSLYNKKGKLSSLIVKKIFIEIRLCNLTYVFKGRATFSKIYIVKFNASILKGLKIMFFCKYKINLLT